MTTTAIRAFSFASIIALATPAFAEDSSLPDASQLPKNVVQISGIVPQMGEHWANPADLPLGPIYGVSAGKVTFLEFMIDKQALAKGTSFLELASKAGIPLPPLDHLDINYEPHGHEGYTVPHYDVHLYFVPHPEHMAITP